MDKIWLVRVLVLMAFAPLVFSHGGGLDANGGHTDSKIGEYHCHREGCSVPSDNPQSLIEGYDRDDWPHWSDDDGDCMNTRHEMLLAQADGDVNLSPDGCYVSTGTWFGPFSGKIYHRASDLDVDHVIPLKWAHDHGGAFWSTAQKQQFANDPLNLLVVDDGLNQSKGAKGPSEWMPPNQGYRCEYLARWGLVLDRYPSLSMTAAEHRVYQRMSNVCTSE